MKRKKIHKQLPDISVYYDEDGDLNLEWIFPKARIGLFFGKDDSGWYVVSDDIHASGPLNYKLK